MTVLAKQNLFNKAMKKYHTQKRYTSTYKFVSFFNIILQLILIALFFTYNVGIGGHFISLLFAFVLADLINGFIHLYMDNTEDYESMWGPFIASFHLHHKTLKYKDASILQIYYNESGAKFWLIPFQVITIGAYFAGLNEGVMILLTYFIVLSCIAEVSHFLCHNSESKVVHFLQNNHFLLSKKHHNFHHQKDNMNYAFLNGMTDPILNFIAKKYYRGYKTESDLHFGLYTGEDTKNR